MLTTTIMNYFAQGVLLVLNFIIYAFIVGKLLPVIFLRPKYKGLKSNDRGLKRYTYEDGRAIVYKPAGETGKYIEQYILSANGDEKFVKCKVHDKVYCIEYDVIAFDSSDKVIDVIAVQDPIKTRGITSGVSLPLETSYVSVIARVVNRVRITKKPTITYSYRRVLAYSLIFSAFTTAEVMFIKNIINPFLEQYLHYSEIVGDNGDSAAMVITAVVSLVCAALVVRSHISDSIKIKNDSLIFALIKKIFTKMRGVRHGKRSTANFKRFLSIFSSK